MAQGQQFGSAAAFSQQISSRMPAPYQGVGLGATGFSGGGFGPQGYSYGGAAGGGYGPGNSFGNSMTSMIGGFGSAMGGAAPFVGGALGFMGGGIGGAIGGFMGGGMIGAGIKHISGAFMEGAHEQSALERTLSQFQFQNAGSRTGHGFNRSDSQQIGNMVRQMERMPEMLTSFGELNRLMDKMGQMGLMQGVRDAGEFMRKFRDTTSVLKDLAKMMGTSMEGALQAFGEARQSGFYSNSAIAKNVLNRQMTASITGMNQEQIGGLQMMGSQMAHAYGGSRAGGASNMLRTAGQLGMLNRMGVLSNNQIVEMTGKEGAAGIEDISQQMGQLAYGMGNSNVGQAMTLALGKMENGRYTGEMDDELVAKVRSGELSLGELKSLARKKAGTRGAKLSFAAHKNRLRTNMASAVGAEGIGMELQEILGEKGWQNPDAFALVSKRFGATEEQTDILQKLMPNLQSIGTQMSLAGRQEARNSAMNAARQEHGFDAIKHRIGKKISHYTTDWAKDLGRGVRDYFQSWADDFMDDLTGQYREYVTKRVADTVKYAMGGSASNKASLAQMSERAQAISGGFGGGNLSVGALSRSEGGAFKLSKELGVRAMHFMSGDETAGERAARVLGGLDKGQYLETGQVSDIERQAKFRGEDVTILESNYWDRAGKGITRSGAAAAQRRLTQLGTAEGGQKEWQRVLRNAGSKDGGDAIRNAYQQAVQSAEIQLEGDPSKRADMIWKKMRGHLPDDVLEKLEKSPMGSLNIIAGVQAAEKAKGNVYAGKVDFDSLGKGLLGGLDLKNQAAIGREIERMDKQFGKSLTGSDTQASWSDVKKVMESGSQMAQLLGGNKKYKGLAKSGLWGDAGDNRSDGVRKLASKERPSDWTPEDLAVLKDMGIDASKLAEEINKDPDAWKRLQGAMQSGKVSADDMAKYLAMTDVSGLNKISRDVNRQGSELASRLKGEGYKTAVAQLQSTKEGKAIYESLQGLSANLEKVDLAKGVGLTDTTADIAGRISGLKGDQRKIALELGGDEVKGAVNYREGLAKKLRGGGMGIDQILKAGNINLGFSEQDMNFKKDLEGMLHGKGHTMAQGDMEKVLNLLTGQEVGKLRSKEGVDANSKYMSEQDISNNLKSLSENNLKATQILANLAAGKTGKDAMEGVGK